MGDGGWGREVEGGGGQVEGVGVENLFESNKQEVENQKMLKLWVFK